MMKKLFVFIFLLVPLIGMSQTYDRTNLKERFERGDVPTQQDFSDLIDSFHNLNEDTYSKTDTINDIATKYDLTQIESGGSGSGDVTVQQLSDTAKSVRDYADVRFWPLDKSFSVSSDTITYSDSLKFLSNSGNQTFLTMFPNKFILKSYEPIVDFGSIIDVNGKQNFHIRHNVDQPSGNFPFNIMHYGGVGEFNIRCKGYGSDLVLMQEVQSGGGGDIIIDNKYTTGENDIIIKSGIGRGAIYPADYSSGFVDRSLVDKGYVDNKFASISLLDTVNYVATKYDLTQIGGGGLGDVTAQQLSDSAQLVRDHVSTNYWKRGVNFNTGSQNITLNGFLQFNNSGSGGYFTVSGSNTINLNTTGTGLFSSNVMALTSSGNNAGMTIRRQGNGPLLIEKITNAGDFTIQNNSGTPSDMLISHTGGGSFTISRAGNALNEPFNILDNHTGNGNFTVSKTNNGNFTISKTAGTGNLLIINNGSGSTIYSSSSGIPLNAGGDYSGNYTGLSYVSKDYADAYKTGSLTDGAPTASELNSVIGVTPSAAGAGHTYKVKDSNGSGLIYQVTSDGTNWHYIPMTQAN